MHTKILIIGSGPAGYSAAIYAARAGLSPILISGNQIGGQLTITTDVENYPGFADVIQGPWLMEQMREQAKHVGTHLVDDHVASVNFSKAPFLIYCNSGKNFTADSVIICTGAHAKWLGLESEERYKGFGVSGCATCDGFFYKNQEVIVIGGGNTAVEEALYLTNHAKRVYLVHRRDSLRAENILQQRLLSNPKVEMVWDTVLMEVKGEENPTRVVSAVLQNLKTSDIKEKPIDGIFIAIGHSPNTAMFKDWLTLDSEGYIQTEQGSVRTNIPGVFAAGDVQDKIYRQAVTAAGRGCMAALDAAKYLSKIGIV
ncbi:thioredoxin-disulfide reductase [Candidatus Lariskella endosymbiont of Hedychridium roseum]|uniref:thioredoxin-disulfide reductase n=1 Tax=Candidatus Lariskella endosymbiont of Hedychridium roseum TaxID=3077949 RepID=UPI0030D1B27F